MHTLAHTLTCTHILAHTCMQRVDKIVVFHMACTNMLRVSYPSPDPLLCPSIPSLTSHKYAKHFVWRLGIWTQVVKHAQQTFYSRIHLSSLNIVFYLSVCNPGKQDKTKQYKNKKTMLDSHCRKCSLRWPICYANDTEAGRQTCPMSSLASVPFLSLPSLGVIWGKPTWN